MYPSINGIQIIVNDTICIKREYRQFRFPKSKKKRIRKKWAKRKENYKEFEQHFSLLDKLNRVLFVSSKHYQEILDKYKTVTFSKRIN